MFCLWWLKHGWLPVLCYNQSLQGSRASLLDAQFCKDRVHWLHQIMIHFKFFKLNEIWSCKSCKTGAFCSSSHVSVVTTKMYLIGWKLLLGYWSIYHEEAWYKKCTSKIIYLKTKKPKEHRTVAVMEVRMTG